MGTRRSSDPARAWTAGASVFSGRRDPEWALLEDDAARLEALWSTLEPLAGDAPVPPPLGYRGCWAQAPGGTPRFAAYRGAVTSGGPRPPETRADPARAFERLVLASVPDSPLRNQLHALAELDAPR